MTYKNVMYKNIAYRRVSFANLELCKKSSYIYRIVLYLNDFFKIKACLSATIKYERYINTNICGTNGHCPSLKGKLVNFG